jgi:hypothetical protein
VGGQDGALLHLPHRAKRVKDETALGGENQPDVPFREILTEVHHAGFWVGVCSDAPALSAAARKRLSLVHKTAR